MADVLAPPVAIRVKTPQGWVDMITRGAPGLPGATGATGPPGATGPQGPPGIVSVQRKAGVLLGYVTHPGGNASVTDGAGGLMQIGFTPTVACWWRVNYQMGLLLKVDAAYHYTQMNGNLSPADQDGAATAQSIFTGHATVMQYGFLGATRIFRLAGGTPYTFTLVLASSGGTWNYYAGPQHLWVDGMAWPQ